MDSKKIQAFIFLVLSFCFALYLGIASATAQIEVLAWVIVGFFFSICTMLGKHVWILIPATLSLRGGINFLPGQIPVWIFMTMTVAVLYLIRVAMRRQKITFRWSKIETALLLVVISILQALVRNPTGLQAFGGETSGGKPYIIFAFAILAYFLVANSNSNFKTWRWAIILYIFFGIVDGLINVVSTLSPQFASIMIRIYSNVSFNAAYGLDQNNFDLMENRFAFLGPIGSLLGLIACSFWRPLAALDFTKPWRGIVAFLALFFTFLSGFRGTVFSLFIRFCLGSLIRRQYIDVLIIVFIGVISISILAVTGLSRSLPFGAQRVLTALPIPLDLDTKAILQADHSSVSRFEMWRIALSEDRYIQNKILGDGFQLSTREVIAMMESTLPNSKLKDMTFEERALEMGDYHGFHVETIRNTGFLGLFASTYALLIIAYYSWRCINLYRGDPNWGYVIFVCMPIFITPFWYCLVFGSYRADFPSFIAMSGMVKLAWNHGYDIVLNKNKTIFPANKSLGLREIFGKVH